MTVLQSILRPTRRRGGYAVAILALLLGCGDISTAPASETPVLTVYTYYEATTPFWATAIQPSPEGVCWALYDVTESQVANGCNTTVFEPPIPVRFIEILPYGDPWDDAEVIIDAATESDLGQLFAVGCAEETVALGSSAECTLAVRDSLYMPAMNGFQWSYTPGGGVMSLIEQYSGVDKHSHTVIFEPAASGVVSVSFVYQGISTELFVGSLEVTVPVQPEFQIKCDSPSINASVTRGDQVVCVLTTPDTMVMSAEGKPFKFTPDSSSLPVVTENTPGSAAWGGIMYATGTISATVFYTMTQNDTGTTAALTARVTVNPRQDFPEVTSASLMPPPIPASVDYNYSDQGRLGFAQHLIHTQDVPLPPTPADGPNKGYTVLPHMIYSVYFQVGINTTLLDHLKFIADSVAVTDTCTRAQVSYLLADTENHEGTTGQANSHVGFGKAFLESRLPTINVAAEAAVFLLPINHAALTMHLLDPPGIDNAMLLSHVNWPATVEDHMWIKYACRIRINTPS